MMAPSVLCISNCANMENIQTSRNCVRQFRIHFRRNDTYKNASNWRNLRLFRAFVSTWHSDVYLSSYDSYVTM